MNPIVSIIGIFILIQLAIILFQLAIRRRKVTAPNSKRALFYTILAITCIVCAFVLLLLFLFL